MRIGYHEKETTVLPEIEKTGLLGTEMIDHGSIGEMTETGVMIEIVIVLTMKNEAGVVEPAVAAEVLSESETGELENASLLSLSSENASEETEIGSETVSLLIEKETGKEIENVSVRFIADNFISRMWMPLGFSLDDMIWRSAGEIQM